MRFEFIPLLAQSSSTNADEIIARMAVLFCVIGIIWVGSVILLGYRTVENRRRKAQGLDPLPPFWIQGYNLIQGLMAPEGAASASQPKSKRVDLPPPTDFGDMPVPDLAMLTGDFPALDLDDDVYSEPEARTIPADPPEYDLTDDELDEEFALDLDEAPVEPDDLPADDPDLELPEDDFMPAATAAQTAYDSPPDAIELLRVWRDISDGTLVLEINGQRFSSLDEVRGADLERRFINVLKELVALTKTSPQTTTPPAAPPPRAQPTAPPPQPKPTASRPAPTMDDEMPSMAPGNMLRQMTGIAMGRKPEAPDEPAPPPLSIPEQIDAILQQRLRTLPQFQGRGIEVQPSLGGLVIIKADGKFYEGVGEVEDDEIRELLQDVVREWEESQ